MSARTAVNRTPHLRGLNSRSMGRARTEALAWMLLGVGVIAAPSIRAQSPQAAQTGAGGCGNALAAFKTAPFNLSITHTDPVAAALPDTVPVGPGPAKIPVAMPAYCRVEGVIGQHTGPDGHSYGLTFALALPDNWNGRFLFQGGGGLNGTLRPPLGADAAGDAPALARGFAVVSTDGGHHSNAVFDGSFMVDQQASLDFAFNAVPTVAAAAKELVAAYYHKPVARSYFDGCSTGGRESMQAAERYPTLFDGIITGAPAMRTGNSNIAQKWAAVAFNQIAQKSPGTGQPLAGSAFSAADRHLIVDRILQACDALDGLKDGMIFNVKACHFDPAVLTCKGAKESDCLSAAQVHALEQAFAGPVTKTGQRVYAAHPYDTGIAAEGPGAIPGFLFTSTGGPVAGDALPVTIDVEAEQTAVQEDPMQQLIDTNRWTDLSTFAARGGKQLIYHGMSDPWFSALDTMDFYERLVKANGGAEQTGKFARLFLVPGMGHCRGGPATLDHFDLLTPLVEWVEAGKAPDAVIATGNSFPGRSRPLCAWPRHAQYKGHGEPNSAASFECKP